LFINNGRNCLIVAVEFYKTITEMIAKSANSHVKWEQLEERDVVGSPRLWPNTSEPVTIEYHAVTNLGSVRTN